MNMNMFKKKKSLFEDYSNNYKMDDPTSDSTSIDDPTADDSSTDESGIDTTPGDLTDETDNTDEADGIDTSPGEIQPVSKASSPSGPNRFNQLMSDASSAPQGPFSQKLSSYLSRPVPSPDDPEYKPGKLDRLSAILGGASEGFQHGAAAGIKTANGVLGNNYRDAMDRYQLEGKNLEVGANLESKNLGRAASFAKTALAEEHNAQTAKLHEEDQRIREAHYNAQDKAAAKKAEKQGFQRTLSSDGHLYYHRVGADGQPEVLDFGKVGESVSEKTLAALKLYSQKEGIRGQTQKDINASNSANISAREKDTARTQSDLIGEREASQSNLIAKREKAAEDRQAATPEFQNKQMQVRIKKLIAKNGEDAKQFLTPDGTALAGPPKKKDSTLGFGGETPEEFKKRQDAYEVMRKYVMGE